MKTILEFAPLQGFTDYRYRTLFNKHFSGIDLFYAPYIRKQKGEIKRSMLNDIDSKNNEGIELVPQIMTNSPEEFVELCTLLQNLGYKNINWNLGCPYPMVTNRTLGSGLLPHPELLQSILSKAIPKINCSPSIKMRLGLFNPNEIITLIPILNRYPIDYIILHPRIGKQLYKEKSDINAFKAILPNIKSEVGYNGDIHNLEDFIRIKKDLPEINRFMIGRGLLANPFLAEEIKSGLAISKEEKIKRLFSFHQDLVEQFSATLSGDHQVLNRLKPYWEYFSNTCESPHKAHKRIKKSKNLAHYLDAVKANWEY